MRILYIAPYFSARQGGVTEVIYQSATQLTRRGHEVTLLTGDFLADDNYYKDLAFHIVRVPSFSHWGFYLTPQMIPWLNNNLKNFDIVHLHEFRTFQNIIASYIASNFNIPFLLTCHGTVPNIIERQGFKRIFDLLFQRRILANIDTFIAVSQKEVDDYRQIGIEPNRIRLIYNGVSIPNGNLTNGERLQLPHANSGKGHMILFLGRLHKRKKIDVLMSAFAILHNRRIDTRLVIAGPDNGEQMRLEQQAKELAIHEHVSFPGPVYGEEKSLLYRSASVLAYPSIHEVFGLVPFEAILCGTPVVVTNEPGMGSIIEEAQAGKTVPKDDPAALAEALSWVLDHPLDASQQVLAGQEFIREHLSWDKIALQLEDVYQERISAVRQ